MRVLTRLKNAMATRPWVWPWLALMAYAIGVLRYAELPGLYMDSVNPDFLAATILHRNPGNPNWTMPGVGIPLLGNLYHGAQNVYTMLPALVLFGANIVGVRVGQALLGGVIVWFLYRLVAREMDSPALGFAAALLLATDIAYIASFRTQNHIILDGMAWVLCSALLLLGGGEGVRTRRRLISSGFFAGLGVYAYFVHAFFLPGFLALLLLITRRGDRLRALAWWGAGLALGAIPYLLGFLAMGIAVGGFDALVTQVRSTLSAIAPMSSQLTLIEAYAYVIEMGRVAITNGGNESMIFHGLATSGPWLGVKYHLVLLALAVLVLLALGRRGGIGSRHMPIVWVALLLPLSYIAVAGLFGKRLWAHHFGVMLPLIYLLLGAAAYSVHVTVNRHLDGRSGHDGWSRLAPRVAGLALMALVAANLSQQARFFGELNRTGGTDNMSDALNRFALESNSEPSSTVFFFPEWGFSMPFSLLTGNRLPIRTGLDAPGLEDSRRRFKSIQVAVWTEEQADHYTQRLQSMGVEPVTRRMYRRRSGEPGLFVLAAPLTRSQP